MTYTSGFVIPTPASQYRMQLRAADRHATPNNNNRRTMSGTCLEFDPIPEPPVDLYMPYISPYRPIPSHAHSPSRDGSPVLQSRGSGAAARVDRVGLRQRSRSVMVSLYALALRCPVLLTESFCFCQEKDWSQLTNTGRCPGKLALDLNMFHAISDSHTNTWYARVFSRWLGMLVPGVCGQRARAREPRGLSTKNTDCHTAPTRTTRTETTRYTNMVAAR
eukprot:2809883-Rhodomonas_salina.1